MNGTSNDNAACEGTVTKAMLDEMPEEHDAGNLRIGRNAMSRWYEGGRNSLTLT